MVSKPHKMLNLVPSGVFHTVPFAPGHEGEGYVEGEALAMAVLVAAVDVDLIEEIKVLLADTEVLGVDESVHFFAQSRKRIEALIYEQHPSPLATVSGQACPRPETQ